VYKPARVRKRTEREVLGKKKKREGLQARGGRNSSWGRNVAEKMPGHFLQRKKKKKKGKKKRTPLQHNIAWASQRGKPIHRSAKKGKGKKTSY